MIGALLLGDGLRAKVVRGGPGWERETRRNRYPGTARNMILTRILAPNAFGAMARVMSCSSIVGTLTDVGQRAAVIQNPRGPESLSQRRMVDGDGPGGLHVRALFLPPGPWVSHFYGNAELSGLLRVALLSTLFEGAMSPRSILPEKNMKFARWMAISNGGAICGVVTTVVLSFSIRDVWALAIGSCSENFFRCLLSYILCPGLPSLRLDRHVVRELYKFSGQ